VLIVNTASQCGFTPQYGGLEKLWRTYRAEGLVVLGFPCNQFGNQEPDDERNIGELCSNTFDVTFPMFAKVDVNGSGAHPLFAWLRREKGGPPGRRDGGR
jgi:glutathione peroxidase